MRERGLGRRLLLECMQRLSAAGLRYISLTVTEGNTGASGLYRRMGLAPRHVFDAVVWQSAGGPG
jgi:ribosomal protein S18 acetylase RimI-like enzyme